MRRETTSHAARPRCSWAVARALVVAGALAGASIDLAGCGRAPWHMGQPLGGVPFVPDGSLALTPSRLRAEVAAERTAGHMVTELRALLLLAEVARLAPTERERLVSLLGERAAEWRRLGRAAALAADLVHIARWRSGESVLPAPAAAEPPSCQPPCRWEDWVLRGPTVAARLLPLSSAETQLRAVGPLADRLARLLVEEDPTSAEALAAAAFVDGAAGRVEAAERKLTDMVFHTPDRAEGRARAARLWERVGQPRRACAAWNALARWLDDPEHDSWKRVLACARRDPRSGDPQAIRRYLLARVSPERQSALRAGLDDGDVPPPPAAWSP